MFFQEYLLVMKFRIGQLVWIISSHNKNRTIPPPAIIVSAYRDTPRIFLNNESANRMWLEEEDTLSEWGYDIIYRGEISVAVSEDWLRPLDP